jgi:hypothetical protein
MAARAASASVALRHRSGQHPARHQRRRTSSTPATQSPPPRTSPDHLAQRRIIALAHRGMQTRHHRAVASSNSAGSSRGRSPPRRKDHLPTPSSFKRAQEGHQPLHPEAQIHGQPVRREPVQRRHKGRVGHARGKRRRQRPCPAMIAVTASPPALRRQEAAVGFRQDEIRHLAHQRRCPFPRPACARGRGNCPRPAPASGRRPAGR